MTKTTPRDSISAHVINLERRLLRAVRLFESSTLRKHELKVYYMDQGDTTDVAGAKMSADMRYKIASEDYRDAMTEMTALSSALEVLYRMRDQGYGI